MSEKLKPCPFCGGEATYWLNNIGGISVGCLTSYRGIDHPRCPVEPIVTTFRRDVETAKEEAIEAWNTRPNPWHTGTPTEDGQYLVAYECVYDCKNKGKIEYFTAKNITHEDGYREYRGRPSDNVWEPVAWQKIEPYKGEK